MKDIDVIARIINKDKNALYLLYDKYSAALFGVILRICENRSLAEDVLQETFVKIWNKMPSYDPEKGRFYTWAYRIAKNTALNAIRNTQPLIQEEDLSVLKVVETSNETHDIEKLNGLLAQLEPHHQQAIRLVYFRGLTHREANEEMGVPLGTFKSYIRQAIQRIREGYALAVLLFFWLMFIA